MERLNYLANIRLPTDKAHGVQIMKACESFADLNVEVQLLVSDRYTSIDQDPFEYYQVKNSFIIKRIGVLDTVKFGRAGFLFETIIFSLRSLVFVNSRPGLIYSRDEKVLFVIALFSNKKFIWESHDGLWNFAARFVAKRSTGIVAVSEGLKSFYINNGVPSEKILAVSNGIDLEKFADASPKEVSRKKLGIALNDKVAMYIGRLDGWKGVGTLLKASTLLPEDIRVILIGGEAKLIDELTITYPRVTFMGFRPYSELPDNQTAADVLIVPNTGKDPISVNFTSPLKLLAHMASGVPIIASDLPSIREIAGSDAVRYVPADDPDALASSIIEIFKDEDTRRFLAAKAKEKILKLTWNNRAKSILFHIRRLSSIL